jgi:hypothetical protein
MVWFGKSLYTLVDLNHGPDLLELGPPQAIRPESRNQEDYSFRSLDVLPAYIKRNETVAVFQS